MDRSGVEGRDEENFRAVLRSRIFRLRLAKAGECLLGMLQQKKMSDRIIRASEIGQYDFCAKAWWLGSIEGVQPTNVRELQAGTQAHEEHGRQVRHAAQMQMIAIGVVALGVIVLVLALLAR